jgi:hypothetical protein
LTSYIDKSIFIFGCKNMKNKTDTEEGLSRVQKKYGLGQRQPRHLKPGHRTKNGIIQHRAIMHSGR